MEGIFGPDLPASFTDPSKPSIALPSSVIAASINSNFTLREDLGTVNIIEGYLCMVGRLG
jgi:hypothetical protein